MSPKDIKLHSSVISCPQTKIAHQLCFGEGCFFKSNSFEDSFCCWRKSEEQSSSGKAWLFLAGNVQMCAMRFCYCISLQNLINYCSSCSASATCRYSAELSCNLKALNWRPHPSGRSGGKHVFHLSPFLSSSFLLCFFSMQQLCFRIPSWWAAVPPHLAQFWRVAQRLLSAHLLQSSSSSLLLFLFIWCALQKRLSSCVVFEILVSPCK